MNTKLFVTNPISLPTMINQQSYEKLYVKETKNPDRHFLHHDRVQPAITLLSRKRYNVQAKIRQQLQILRDKGFYSLRQEDDTKRLSNVSSI